MNFPFGFTGIIAVLAVIYASRAFRIVRQFEKGLVETFGQFSRQVGAGLVTQMAGLGIAREGLVLSTNDFSFVVAEPCSGMSSLVSLLALAAVWTHLSQGKLPARIAILASVLPIVLLANTIRVSLVLLIASIGGQEAALGFFHSASSLVLFGLALAGLLFISRVVGCKAPRFAI